MITFQDSPLTTKAGAMWRCLSRFQQIWTRPTLGGFPSACTLFSLCSTSFTLCYDAVASNKALEGGFVTMLYFLRTLYLFCLSLISFTCVKSLFIAQDDCPDVPGQPRVVTSVLVVKHTIRIITNIPIDTTLHMNTDLSITVNNAPTELDIITTYYSRSTASQTYAGKIPLGLTRYTKGNFVLVVVSNRLSPKRRRQAGSFISYNGRTTSSCAQASTLSLNNGQLFVTFANGTVAQYSANAGDPYDVLMPSTTPGAYTTTFSLSNTGTLLWTNPNFYNGGALFCVLPSGVLLAVFQQGSQPTSCVFIDLTITELTACPAPGSLSSGQTAPTILLGNGGLQGPTGPTGPSGLSGPTGPQGLVGATGPSGPQGLVGATGPSGPQGIAGVTGALGPSGPSGPQGLVGATGPSGAQGLPGATGVIGPSGPQGLTGATGPSGPQGLAGATGPSGPQGLAGATGPSGLQGLVGATGPFGPQGLMGAIGPSGAQGSMGATGPSGLQGLVGPTGPSGAQGLAGATGPAGQPGPVGATGPSGPQGLVGATGPSGPQGLLGPTGPSGPQGLVGATGPSGPQGLVGATGPSGPQGLVGPTGPSGLRGPTGVTGMTGPTGATGPQGFAYSFVSCFYQTGTSSSSSGKVLSNFIATYTSNANFQCAAACNSLNNNFYAVTNVGTVSVDCYCGDVLSFVTVVGLGSGLAPDNNCGTCVGGPAPAGECGIQSSSTVAVYARAY
ncbi:hypothetical protein N7G274_003451 [Stereocaulon virgatum]|uniref:WSC domain-containing protein n=1 Tax=Stereocaulon virgatum TaxID=373712 RepID=A0ABR4AEM1_9LECA